MIQTAEPIELLAFAAAVGAFVYSTALCSRAVALAQAARGLQLSVQTIGWSKAGSEVIRAGLAVLCLFAGFVQVLTPPPGTPTWSRPWLQLVWVLLPVGLILLSGLNDWSTRRLVRMIRAEKHGE